MRILSNFDTKYEKKLLSDYKKQFGKDNVVVIHKSKLFFWKYIGLPISVWAALFIVGISLALWIQDVPTRAIWVVLWIFVMYAFGLFFKISRKWIDYTMDFLIVTPKEVVKFDQSGVFNKEVEKLHADKIKSITITKPWFFNSMFDIWTITFLAEGESEKGDIVMDYVDAVEEKERKIMHVLGNDTAGR